MISVPVAVNNNYFKPQLELLWFNHKATYGEEAARRKVLAVIVKRNTVAEERRDFCEWARGVPHVMVDAYFDVRPDLMKEAYLPINIQMGLSQVIASFDDEEIIEV